MDAEQELVYGWLGLNPALLLDPVPTADNLMVRVVRPGEYPEAVLEEARQQLAAAGPRRRRRGRGSNPSPSPTSGAAPAIGHGSIPEHMPVTVELTPLPVETFPAVPVLPESGLELLTTPAEPEAHQGRRVRSRGRSASSAGAAVAVLPVVEPSSLSTENRAPSGVATAAVEEELEEPRRRRRRSSATE
jgi:ribonuclease E